MHDDENANDAAAGVQLERKKTLEQTCFQSLSETQSGLNGVTITGKTVPGCMARKGEGPFSQSLSDCGPHAKTETVRE